MHPVGYNEVFEREIQLHEIVGPLLESVEVL